MGRGEKVTLDGFAGTPEEDARPKRKRVRAEPAPEQVPEPEPAAAPEPEPEEVTVETDEGVVTYVPTATASVAYDRGHLRAMVSVPRGKTQAPTLVRYRQDGDRRIRTLLTDVGESQIRAGWEYYRSTVAGATPESFLKELGIVLHPRPPRLYKVVAEMTLTDENL